MTDQKPNQPIDLSEANQPSDFIERETEKPNPSDEVQSEQDFTYEQTAENKIAHQQNVTAHIPGGSTDADLDK
ncbi:hypothetical protein [Myxosarcina sp. GI1(2024)]